MEAALWYFEENYAMLERDYPFTSGATGENTFDCLYSQTKSSQHNVIVNSIGRPDLHEYVESIDSFKAAIKQQPLIIAIAANNKYIHSYKSGIIDSEDCNTAVLVDHEWLNTINHGVLAVGYGLDKTTGLEYVLVKNSWNTTWGDSGYFKLRLYGSIYYCGQFYYESWYPVLN